MIPDGFTAWQHRKGGIYTVLGFDPKENAVVYVAHLDGKFWERPLDEFMDGRFTRSSVTPLTASQIARRG